MARESIFKRPKLEIYFHENGKTTGLWIAKTRVQDYYDHSVAKNGPHTITKETHLSINRLANLALLHDRVAMEGCAQEIVDVRIEMAQLIKYLAEKFVIPKFEVEITVPGQELEELPAVTSTDTPILTVIGGNHV